MLRIHFTPRDLNDRDLYLDGRGIELQPSAFCWQVPTKLRDPELTPILVYPIQHAPGMLGSVAVMRSLMPRAMADPTRPEPAAVTCEPGLGGTSSQIVTRRGVLRFRRALALLPTQAEWPSPDRRAGSWSRTPSSRSR